MLSNPHFNTCYIAFLEACVSSSFSFFPVSATALRCWIPLPRVFIQDLCSDPILFLSVDPISDLLSHNIYKQQSRTNQYLKRIAMPEEEESVVDMVIKSTDPAFKLFGRRIPVISGSDSTTERSSDSATDSSEVTKFMKSSSEDTKSCIFSEKALGFKGETTCWDEDSKYFSKAVEIGKKMDGGMHLQGAMSGMEKVGEQKLEMGVQENNTQNQENNTQNPEQSKIGDDNHNIGGEGCEEGSNESGNKSGDEVPKKPSKVLPCPRCESMDTKFCYYNNYNVNQPRHFCRNCQRYWTAGGLLRNVPVGAGRRKSKHSVGIRSLGHGNGSDCPIGNSEESVKFEISDLHMGGYAKKGEANHLGISGLFSNDNENLQKSSCSLNQNGENFWSGSWRSSHDSERGESGEFPCPTIDDSVCASSNTKFTKSEMELSYESNNTLQDQGGVCCQLPNSSVSWVGGPPPIWPMYYGSFFGNSPYMGGAMLNPESLQAPAMMPWFQPCPGFPWAFPSGQMWAQPSWGPAWGMPLRPAAPLSTSLDGSPSMLGKHTRDLSVPQSDVNGDGSIWVPKTLRIDDPEEAAKSSIWTTLGLGSKPESITSGGIFKAFQPKTENKDNSKTPDHVLCANPAASTRSASFNESS